jgi:hypothetical protein
VVDARHKGRIQLLQQTMQQQQSRLCLPNFISDSLCAASMVAALPAHSLTHLILDVGREDAFDGAALSAALAHLSSLQQLWLTNKKSFSSSNTPGSCLAGIAQLTRLTSLSLDGYWPEV